MKPSKANPAPAEETTDTALGSIISFGNPMENSATLAGAGASSDTVAVLPFPFSSLEGPT